MADIFDVSYKFLNKTVSYLFGKTYDGEDKQLIANKDGHLIVDINDPITAFGELSTAQNIAFIQASGVYEFIPNNFREFTSLGGSTGISDRMFTVQSGTTQYGYAAIQSFRSLNYRPGQGGMIRFTALFQNAVDDHWSGVGLVNLSDELSFGYNGTTFGIWHRYGGVAECRTITVTGGSAGATNLTLTLNSVAYTIPLTAGTATHNSYEIANWLNANQSVWVADQIDGTVIIIAQSDGAKSGTYSFSHATATGTIAQNKAGVTKTSVHIPQADWNQDTRADIDPTKGNVFQIAYQYLGFGAIYFYAENSVTGTFGLVHIIKYNNTYTTPSLRNPSLRYGIYSASVGSTTNVIVQSASVGAFVQGNIARVRNPRSFKNTQVVSTTLTNVLSIRNRRTLNSLYNQVEIELVHISLSTESAKNVEIEIRTNPTFSSNTNYANVGTNLVSDYDITANTVTGGTLLASFTLGSTGSQSISLTPFEIIIPSSLVVCVAARVTSGASSNVTATLTWYEDI